MEIISASKARAMLYELIDQTASTHIPVTITGKRNNAVLVSADDWSALQETLYLLSIPGMRDSIHEGMATPISECEPELRWRGGTLSLQHRLKKTLPNFRAQG